MKVRDLKLALEKYDDDLLVYVLLHSDSEPALVEKLIFTNEYNDNDNWSDLVFIPEDIL